MRWLMLFVTVGQLFGCAASSVDKHRAQPAPAVLRTALCHTDRTTEAPSEPALRDSNHLASDFVSPEQAPTLKGQALAFINVLRTGHLLVDTCLRPKSVSILRDESKTYLRAGFESANKTYNIDLSGQKVHRQIVENSLEPILRAIAAGFNSPDEFDGYDIGIWSSIRHSGDFGSTWSERRYRFLMPRALVQRYIDRQLTMQQLLDQSDVSRDNMKIEIRLK